MFELKNISKHVDGDCHLDDISVVFESGSLNVLLGATRAGKTSLLRIMAGLDKPTQGSIWANDTNVTALSVKKRSVAMVYQQFINYPMLSVYENIASPLRIASMDERNIKAEVYRVAELLKLTPYLESQPLQLSGGQQQRTAIARAVVKQADLVLLDEPLVNLDYKLREELCEELPKILSASGQIFVYATTEPTEALLLGGNCATLYQGRMIQFGQTIDVYRLPKNQLSAQIFSDPPLNTLPVRKQQQLLYVDEHQTSIALSSEYNNFADGYYTLGIRAHHLLLTPKFKNDKAIPACVIVTEITGSESFIHVSCLGQRWVVIAHGVHRFEPNQIIDVYIDNECAFLFDESGILITGQVSH